MVEAALFLLVTGNSNIATIIGNRFYPDGDVPDVPTLPFASYLRVSTPHTNRTHEGRVYQTPRFQINCYDRTSFAAKSLVEVMDTELDSYRGTVGDWRIDCLQVVDIRDSYEVDTEEHTSSLDLIIWAVSS